MNKYQKSFLSFVVPAQISLENKYPWSKAKPQMHFQLQSVGTFRLGPFGALDQNCSVCSFNSLLNISTRIMYVNGYFLIFRLKSCFLKILYYISWWQSVLICNSKWHLYKTQNIKTRKWSKKFINIKSKTKTLSNVLMVKSENVQQSSNISKGNSKNHILYRKWTSKLG